MFKQVLTLSTALLLWTPSLGAQQSDPPATGAKKEAGMMARGMMQSGGMGRDTMDKMGGDMGMMSPAIPGPAMLARMGRVLGLTEEQTTELEAIQAALTDDRATHMPLAKEAHEQAAALIAGDEPDLSGYEASLREAMGHMIAVHVRVARAAFDARALLTDEQRTRLEGAMGMKRHMESRGDGGMHGTSDRDAATGGHEDGSGCGG